MRRRGCRCRSRLPAPAPIAGPQGLVLPFGTPSGRWVRKVHRAEIAQLVEHATENRGVASSILALGTSTGARSLRAEVAQLVEHHLAKVRVAGSSPVFRSIPLPSTRHAAPGCPFV